MENPIDKHGQTGGDVPSLPEHQQGEKCASQKDADTSFVLPDPPVARVRLGLPESPEFLEGCGPRPVDLELLRKAHRRELDVALDAEISRLVTTYRDWFEADLAVLREIAGPEDSEES